MTTPTAAGGAAASTELSLRQFLLGLPDSKDDGFEGLARILVAGVAGTPLRLAKSGTQFGADARSADGAGKLAVEAKRYQSPPTQASLLAKLDQAVQAPTGKPDLWVLVSTAELGAQDNEALVAKGKREWVTVTIIDWQRLEDGTPKLMALILAGLDRFERWCMASLAKLPPLLRNQLRALKSTSDWAHQLRPTLQPGLATYRGIKTALRDAYLAAFAEKNEAVRLFRQQLTPLAADTIPRADVLDAIGRLLHARKYGLQLILGEEGVGKSWAIASYWLEREPDAFFLFISAREPWNGENFAALFSSAIEKAIGVDIKSGFQQFFEIARQDRCILVIDGLNENMAVHWPNILEDLEQLVGRDRGSAIVTCRPLAWRFMAADWMDAKSLTIQGYSRDEVQMVLARAGVDYLALPDDVADGLSNPRYCRLAIELVRDIGLAGVTRDRILWHYWKRRLSENRNLRLSEARFHGLLRNHARRLMESASAHAKALPSPIFDLDGLEATGDKRIAEDLSEIVEGRFFSPVADAGNDSYAFRSDAMAFALGLELVETIAPLQGEAGADALIAEALAKLVEPVSAFDRTAEILVSALAVAALKRAPMVAYALIVQITDLQNRDEALAASFAAYVADLPESYIRAAEDLTIVSGGEEWLVGALRGGLHIPAAAQLIEQAIGRWFRNERFFSGPAVVRDGEDDVEPNSHIPVGMLIQLAAQCAAGYPLDAFASDIEASAVLSPNKRNAEDVRLLAWLAFLDRSGGYRLRLPIPNGLWPMREPEDDENDEFLVHQFPEEDDADTIAAKLVSLPKQLGSPFAVLRTCQYLESGLLELPVDRRLPLLMALELPTRSDGTSGKNESWPSRRSWRPTLGADGPAAWILACKGDERKLAQACLYLADQGEFELDAASQHVLGDFLTVDTFDDRRTIFRSIADVVLITQARETGLRLLQSGWTCLSEHDAQVTSDGSLILAVASAIPGIYPLVRQHMDARHIPQAIASVAPGDLALAIEDLVRAASVMTSEIAADTPVTADGLGDNPDFDLGRRRQMTELAQLTPDAIERIAKADPEALFAIADRFIGYTEFRRVISGPLSFAYALLPKLSRLDPDRADTLLLALWNADIRNRGLLRARQRSQSAHDFQPVFAMAATPSRNQVARDMIALGTDDTGMEYAARAMRNALSSDETAHLLACLSADSHEPDRARHAAIAFMLGVDPPPGYEVGLPGTVVSWLRRLAGVSAARRQAMQAWIAADAGPGRRDLERKMMLHGVEVLPPDGILDLAVEAQDLLRFRLAERFGSNNSRGERFMDTIAPPDWVARLNCGSWTGARPMPPTLDLPQTKRG